MDKKNIFRTLYTRCRKGVKFICLHYRRYQISNTNLEKIRKKERKECYANFFIFEVFTKLSIIVQLPDCLIQWQEPDIFILYGGFPLSTGFNKRDFLLANNNMQDRSLSSNRKRSPHCAPL